MANQTMQFDLKTRQLHCPDNWNLAHLPQLKAAFKKISWPQSGAIIFDGSGIKNMDSAGAWLLNTWKNNLEQQGLKVELQHFSQEYTKLLALIDKKMSPEKKIPKLNKLTWIAEVGKYTTQQIKELNQYLIFIGRLTSESLSILKNPARMRFRSLVSIIFRNGYQALPIIALLSFMIGVVIAYQMGLQLRNYGANIYIVDLLGLSVLREFGPLLTAIMVAGRTGSSFTAQLGIMKINQEIDALNTIGVTPAEILLLPRIIGLFIALPLLTIWADFFGVVGGMVMANNMLNVTTIDFLLRFPEVIPLRALLIGLGKAPVFALIIASVGCFQGVQVKEDANSLGLNTTKSVVISIFFIIVVDALFSIIFSKLRL